MVMGVPLHHRAMVEGGGDDVELGVRVVTGAAAIEGAHGRGGDQWRESFESEMEGRETWCPTMGVDPSRLRVTLPDIR
jgi:hypothetical protein